MTRSLLTARRLDFFFVSKVHEVRQSPKKNRNALSLGGGGGFRKGRKWSLPVSLLSDLIPPERRESQDPLETLSRASLMVLRRTFPFNGPSPRFV